MTKSAAAGQCTAFQITSEERTPGKFGRQPVDQAAAYQDDQQRRQQQDGHDEREAERRGADGGSRNALRERERRR